jgi:serine/threonine-protein kinase
MAPEQVRCGRVDHRADLFSVGVMLWEAIARRTMHGNASLYEVVGRLVNGELPSLRDAVPQVDRHLESVVARALALNPDARFENAGALRDELLVFLDARRKVSSREIGERVARLFEPEREAIGKVIWQAMNDVPSDELLARVNAARVLAELPWVSTHAVRTSGTDPATAAEPLPSSTDRALAGFRAPSAHREREEGSGVSSQFGAITDRSSMRPGNTRPLGPIRSGDGPRPADEPRPGNAAGPAGGEASKATPPSSLRRRAPWLLAIGAGLVAVLAVLGRPLTAGTPEPIIVDVPAPVARVRLNLQATPPSARFVLDGRALESNPYRGEHAADAFPHTLEVSAEGHQRRSIEVGLNRDLDLDVRLAEAPAQPPSPSSTAAPSAAATPQPAAVRAPRPAQPVSAREPRSTAPARRAPEAARSHGSPAPSPAASRQVDDIYPDEPLPDPKPVPLEAF